MTEIIKTLADFKKEIENPNEAVKAYVAYLVSLKPEKPIFKQ
jgi:hypothetical protein